MSNLDIKIRMLETLYDLADKGRMNSLRNFSKYVIAINDDMPGLLEHLAYKDAINKIFRAANTFEVDDLKYAEESINTYKRIMDWSKNRDVFC